MRNIPFYQTSVSSSKIAAILNKSPFKNAIDQYKLDTKQVKPDFSESTKQKLDMGTLIEPVIKTAVERYFKINLTVDKEKYSHDDYDFFRVEFDALDYTNKVVYEFKNTEMDEAHILEAYYPQVQFAMFIIGWDNARICYLRNGWDLGYIDVARDDNFIEGMVEAGKYYWNCLTFKVEPDLSVIDSLTSGIEFYSKTEKPEEVAEFTDTELEDLYAWGKLKREISKLEDKEKEYKDKYSNRMGKFKNEELSYSNSYSSREGSLDIRALIKDYPEINLAHYRKPDSVFTRQSLRYKPKAEDEEVTINRIGDIV